MTTISKCYLLPAVVVICRRNRKHTKKEKINSIALNKINCHRKFLLITYHFILSMTESIEPNIKLSET